MHELFNLSGTDGSRISFEDQGTRRYTLGNEGTAFSIYDASASSERLRIDSSGNLLVGATSPKNTFCEKTLSVIASASNSQGMIEIGGNYTSDTFISGLSFTNEQSTDTSNFRRIAQISAFRDGNNNAGDLVFDVHDNSTLNRGMTIKSSGNVGIGTTTPGTLLHLSNASDPTVRVQDSSSGMVVGLQANDSTGFVGTTSNSDFAIRTNNSTRLHIENSGNVGIGTTSPSHKLDIVVGGL
jgi:hypothetical protein